MILAPGDLEALLLTLRLAAITTMVLVAIAIPLSFGLFLLHSPTGSPFENRPPSRWYGILRSLVTLPLVLPPTVLGFYLILLLAPDSPLVAGLGLPNLLFSFPGLVLGSVLFSLPLTVAPITDSFLAIPAPLIRAARDLELSRAALLAFILVPLGRKGIITGAALGFAHTVGEFGVVLMIGGNIPGSTRLLSMAIYDHVEALDFNSAHRLSAVALAIAFALLVIIHLATEHKPERGS